MKSDYLQIDGLVYLNGEVQFDGLSAHTQHAALITALITRLNELEADDSRLQSAQTRISSLEARNIKLTKALYDIQWLSGPTTAGRARKIAREALGSAAGVSG
jgi:hypothetical protein